MTPERDTRDAAQQSGLLGRRMRAKLSPVKGNAPAEVPVGAADLRYQLREKGRIPDHDHHDGNLDRRDA
jgi:hypothetical protein